VTSVNITRNRLQPRHLSNMQKLLIQFPALNHINLSFNPALGCSGVISIFSSLTGTQPPAQACSSV